MQKKQKDGATHENGMVHRHSSILLRRDKVTAPELMEQFEVSRYTIQRDIEFLCQTGIPIATAQGTGGGISILEGYWVDRTVLTTPEMQAILTGLRPGPSTNSWAFRKAD